MKFIFSSLIVMVLAVSAIAVPTSKKPNKLEALNIEDAFVIDDVVLPKVQTEKTVSFPAMPAKRGKVAVLRLKMVSYTKTPGGCQYNAKIAVNDAFLNRYTAENTERLLGRSATFGLLWNNQVREFPIFAGQNIMTIFAPNAEAADKAVADGMGGTFLFDISDLVRGVDGNALTIRNIRPAGAEKPDLIATAITIGYLDRNALPKPPSAIPKRSSIAGKVTNNYFELYPGKAGGFVVQNRAGQRMAVETAVGMTPQTKSELIAQDVRTAKTPKLNLKSLPDGFELTAVWPDGLEMVRKVSLKDSLLCWQERWSNNSNKILGVPVRYRFFIPDSDLKYYVGGNCDNGSVLGSPRNPTLFLEDKKSLNGFGITAENDWLRLLLALRCAGGVAELYTNQLALSPGKSIDFEMTIDGENENEGYWGFINRLRKRWLGNNTITAPAPFFWNSPFEITGSDEAVEASIRKYFAHLGKAVVPFRWWSRLNYDTKAIHSGKISRKADGAPDIEKFVTFEHRKPYYEKFKQIQAIFRKAAPEAILIPITHPAMEITYVPESGKWPYAADEIKTVSGTCFNDPYYSRAYLYGQVKNGWAIYYYVPTEGGKYYNVLLNDVKRYIDDFKTGGIYFDEFSFAGGNRGYSRYNYAKSDGYSADLDQQGNFIRFKSDNGMASKAAQIAIVKAATSRNGYFYGNGGPALRETQTLPALYFTEGGNGLGKLAGGHLTQVPMALGNFGDYKTRKGIFDAAKAALSTGTIYSPNHAALLLEDGNNFISKMYPITIERLGAGTITGKERIITTKAGEFTWNIPDGEVTLYCYDANGNLIKPIGSAAVKNGRIKLSVPDNGMTIAEKR